MANAKILQSWRPSPLVFTYCALAIALLGGICFCGVALLATGWYPPERPVQAGFTGLLLFLGALMLSLRRCSTPALPAFRGLLLITAYMTMGMGTFSLMIAIPAVVFAVLSVFAIALVSLFQEDTDYATSRFRRLLEFYRKHRMYQ